MPASQMSVREKGCWDYLGDEIGNEKTRRDFGYLPLSS